MEQLIDLEENSCLWNVSNKDYYLRKKRERAYKQIEEKLGTERAVIKAKITTLRQQCWPLLRPCAYTTQQVPITPNNIGSNNAVTCCVRLRGPLSFWWREIQKVPFSTGHSPKLKRIKICDYRKTFLNRGQVYNWSTQNNIPIFL